MGSSIHRVDPSDPAESPRARDRALSVCLSLEMTTAQGGDDQRSRVPIAAFIPFVAMLAATAHARDRASGNEACRDAGQGRPRHNGLSSAFRVGYRIARFGAIAAAVW